ncbi:hypothetical protein TNCV_4060371 [Trichonephila clavipes]|nr:hypothetical protein TNCV_4060371 [Trichonephila clavipes]
MLVVRLSLAVVYAPYKWQYDLAQFHPNFEGEHSGSGQRPSTNFRRGHAARRLFRVRLYPQSAIHLQTSMPCPGFEPRPYGTVVNVINHYIGWAASCFSACHHSKPNHWNRKIRIWGIY